VAGQAPANSAEAAGQPVGVVRRIRDDIDVRVRQLLAELVPAST
jgi:hypothetical protein